MMRIASYQSVRVSSPILPGTRSAGRAPTAFASQPLFAGKSFSLRSVDREPGGTAIGFDPQVRARINHLIGEMRGLVSRSGEETPIHEGMAEATEFVVGVRRRIGPPHHGIASTIIRGIHGSQFAGAAVYGLPIGSRLIVSGEISQAARAASLTVRGDVSGRLTAGGTYELVGASGRSTLQLAAGESLESLAERINEQSAATGVVAAVANNDLTLTSVRLGSAATVELRALSPEYDWSASGLNPAQIEQLQIHSLASGASEMLSGEYLGPAEAAELEYVASTGGVVTGTASFRLTGTRGDTAISLTAGESLAGVADRINQQSAATGVVAVALGNRLRLSSDTVGSGASVRVDQVAVAHDTSVTGQNASQLAGFAVLSLDQGSEHVIGGTVTRAGTKATVVLQGSSGAAVIDSATFRLSGSLGSAVLSIAEGESLSAVSERVNATAAATGVTARVAGDQLVFESQGFGSSAAINVELLEVAHETVVTGVNSQQFASFAVNDFTTGASHALGGTIMQTAGKAELTFTGFLGFVGTNANITLSGTTGSTQLSVSSFQSVSSFAAAVNQRTATTGVTATVQGNQVKLWSVGVGTAATVAVQVNSGSFQVTGGNGNGTANGTNAVAVVNGQAITGAGNQFQFTDAMGSYQFTSVAGFTGAFEPVQIDSVAGSFVLSGDNGDGTATGLDALGEFDGVELTGDGNSFVVSRAGGQFALEIAAGFAGAIDPITVRSLPQPFVIEGGDGAGLALGRDATAIINGASYASADGRFFIDGRHGSYTLEFAGGFAGPFDPITVASTPRVLDIVGGDGAGFAAGSDVRGIINGQAVSGVGDVLRLVDHNRFIALVVQPEFTGPFASFVAERVVQTMSGDEETEQTARAPASPLPSDEVSPFSVRLDELLDELAQLTEAATIGTLLASAASGPASRGAILNRQFANYVRASSLPTTAALDDVEFSRLAQLRRLVDLLV
jgi:hypothetical protein